jgi:hypothetical protein
MVLCANPNWTVSGKTTARNKGKNVRKQIWLESLYRVPAVVFLRGLFSFRVLYAEKHVFWKTEEENFFGTRPFCMLKWKKRYFFGERKHIYGYFETVTDRTGHQGFSGGKHRETAG